MAKKKLEDLEYEHYIKEIGNMPKILEMTEEEAKNFEEGFKEGSRFLSKKDLTQPDPE